MEIVFAIIGLTIIGLLAFIYRKLDWIAYVVLIEFDKINDNLFTDDVCDGCKHD